MTDEPIEELEDAEVEAHLAEAEASDAEDEDDEPDFELHGQFFEAPSE
jgi:hypothetical protein